MNQQNEDALQVIRHMVRDDKKSATVLGFGPRFLHSTGQAYKGGPTSGVFLQITCDDKIDLPVPGQKYTFSVVKARRPAAISLYCRSGGVARYAFTSAKT